MLNHILDLIRTCTRNSHNQDSVDKFNSKYCAITLMVLATFVITNQLVGDSIDCWTDAQFNGQWVKFTDQICWLSNTYHLPSDITPEEGRNTKHSTEIMYYQWVPLILAMQALLFFLPSLVWSAAADSFIDISNIVGVLSDKSLLLEPEKRDKSMKNVAVQFNRYVKNRREYSRTHLSEVRRDMRETNSFCLACGSRSGNYLGLIYLVTKALFVFNAWAQLFCLDSFLGPKFHTYGFDFIQNMYEGVDMTHESPRFPLVTLCDFSVRKMGTIQKHTVQCVLSVNLFNSRIFVVVWFMIMFAAIINSANLLLWLWRMILRKNRFSYIRKHLSLMERTNTTKSLATAGHFVDRYLQHDGVFVIRLMSKNATSMVISEMIAALFDTYIENGGKSHVDEPLLRNLLASNPSVKGSNMALDSRRGSLRGPKERKRSLPPSYNSSYMQFGRKMDNFMFGGHDNDDQHSGTSSESGTPTHYPQPVSQLDPTITAEELAQIRRILRNEKNPFATNAPSAPPPPPPLASSVSNHYSAAPTLPNNVYPVISQNDQAFNPDTHPKAREAAQAEIHRFDQTEI